MEEETNIRFQKLPFLSRKKKHPINEAKLSIVKNRRIV